MDEGEKARGYGIRLTPAGSDHLVDEVLVGFAAKTSKKDIMAILNATGCRPKAAPIELGETVVYTVDIADNLTVEQAINSIKGRPGVKYAEPNGLVSLDEAKLP